jgi:DNA polymerase elongation subunit (family B)
MLENIKLENILFLDIETVPEHTDFLQLDGEMQALYEAKTAYQRKENQTAEEYYERAGIWAEFGKIVCISVGFFAYKKGERQFRTTSFWGDEPQLLLDFSNLLNTHFNQVQHLLCGHNTKEFDYPYIARRMLINGVKIPDKLNLVGKKTVGSCSFRYDGIVEVWRLQTLHIIKASDQNIRNSFAKR